MATEPSTRRFYGDLSNARRRPGGPFCLRATKSLCGQPWGPLAHWNCRRSPVSKSAVSRRRSGLSAEVSGSRGFALRHGGGGGREVLARYARRITSSVYPLSFLLSPRETN